MTTRNIFTLLFTTFFHVINSQITLINPEIPTNNKVYIVTRDENIIPDINEFGESSSIYTQNASFNSILTTFNVFDFKQPFYSAITEQLKNTYQIDCECDAQELLNALVAGNYNIDFIEICPSNELMYTPNDYDFSTAYCSGNVIYDNWHLDKINAEQAWDISKGDQNVEIAIIDDGVPNNLTEFTNSDGSSQIVYSNGINPGAYHGTFVASLAGASTDNGNLLSSIGFKCRLMTYGGLSYSKALLAAQAGAKVINLSWGSTSYSNLNQLAINEIVMIHGALVVASAGNANYGSATQYFYPASYNNVISVTSTGPNDEHNYFGTHKNSCNTINLLYQYNNKVDLCAPGYNVLGMGCCNVAEPSSGTSMAAPIVSGLAGLVYSVNPNFTPWDVECILKRTAVNINGLPENAPYVGGLGAGRIDAYQALLLAEDYAETIVNATVTNTCGSGASGSIDLEVSGNGPFTYQWSHGATSEDLSNLAAGEYTVTITNAYGCICSMNKFKIEAPFMSLNLTASNPCSDDEGSIEAAVFGGIEPYSYSWNTGDNTPSIFSVREGDYSVVVEDANGCTLTAEVTLTNQIQAVDFDYPDGLIINSNAQTLVDANGDGIIRVRGVMQIASGVNYKINSKVLEFARDLAPDSPDQGITHSGLIVNKNAKLTANNTTFRGVSECASMWEGIQVWGDDVTKGDRIGTLNSILKNGVFVANNCIIRDADIGVALYRTHQPFFGTKLNYGRGVIKASETSFINNRIGIDFNGSYLVENNSSVTQCNFSCTQPLIHPYRYNGEGTDVFIRLRRVQNPKIKASVFSGSTSFNLDKRATAIRSYDASYSVESGNTFATTPATPPNPNVFNNLSQGIDAYSIGGAAATIKIKDNRFNNVYQGITANGNNFDEISFNVFNLPSGDADFNSWGIFMQTSSGFLATENEFNTLSTNEFTFGMVARDVNLANGLIYKNTFEGSFESATQVEGSSSDNLQIDCNSYKGGNTRDWAILSGTLADQGGCLTDDFTAPALNLFGACSLLDNSQIYSVADFVYSTVPAVAPLCVNSSVAIDLCIEVLNFENACPQIVSEPCIPCAIVLENSLNSTPPGKERNKIKGELMRQLAQNGDIQGMLAVLSSESTPNDKKIIIPSKIQSKEYIQARQELNELEISSIEDQRYYELFDVLTTIGESGRELDEITDNEKHIIENVAASETQVATNAQSVLAELAKSRYIRIPERIISGSAMNIASNNYQEVSDKQNIKFNVFPNPSKGDFVVSFEKAAIGKGQIIDSYGRVVESILFNDRAVNYEIKGIAQGFYTMVIFFNDGTMENRRITVN